MDNLIIGDDWSFLILITDGSDNPADITGGAVWLTFKVDPDTQDDDTLADFQLVNTDIQDGDDPGNDAANGKVYLRAAHDSPGTSPPDNTLISKGQYKYDVQYRDIGGAITTIVMGSVTVDQQVTRSV